ncbi:chemotaxis protein CheB [Dissulfurimicrobium hydrothermale]|uniref:chemotaxis protein CheB n=1 Tax=Dissulfurimicrobium hydrothermale TaxID=1750598 RepID=UPI001EDAAA5B|nr:chemotaxis protein CheB [Dissulfurimicrobium hydrothermale]UKL14258.1 chemotaxis protein CheB [Dissulfurimicrobium hydrothermale]
MQELQTGLLTREGVKKTKVLVVDDSPLMCKVLADILSEDPALQIVGQALSGGEAIEILSKTPCDVCTLDVHMPGMSGLSVLKHIMIRSPTPTLMVSAFTSEGAKVTFEALRYGAVDFFQKPSRENGADIEAQKAVLQERVKRAARVQLKAARYLRLRQAATLAWAGDRATARASGSPHGLIALIASTGGYASLLSLLPLIKGISAPVVVFMRAHPSYLKAFVNYIGAYVSFEARLAGDGEPLQNGKAYFINSDDAASIDHEGGDMLLHITPRCGLSERETGVDLFLYSASEHFGDNMMAVFLSGDGVGGLNGAKELLRLGGRVLVQDPDTCLAPETPALIAKETGADVCLVNELAGRIGGWGRGRDDG